MAIAWTLSLKAGQNCVYRYAQKRAEWRRQEAAS
jgi:hypothetical protein